MADIRHRGTRVSDPSSELRAEQARKDDQVASLIAAVKVNRSRAAELARVDVRVIEAATKEALAKMLAEVFKGQLPPQLAKALVGGQVDDGQLQQLLLLFAHSSEGSGEMRTGRAPSPEAARMLASDGSVPQHALRWGQFAQKAQPIPGANLRGRQEGAAPKGEATTLLEVVGSQLAGATGPGLRSPRLVAREMSELSPGQRALLMRATFGDRLAALLEALGIEDPLHFVRAGALPEGREQLADRLGLPRARLFALLTRVELLKIGPGRNGEMGIRPELLGPLRDAGITMLGTLAAVRGLSHERLSFLYGILRQAAGGFRKVVSGGRIPVKRDLLHWARAAGRRPSDILLAGIEERGARGLSRSDAQELIQAWYQEQLFYDHWARNHAQQEREHPRRVDRDEHPPRDGERDNQDDSPDEDDEPWASEPFAELEYDHGREDNLMCFWVTDFNADPLHPTRGRRMYVCVDPGSGAIIPQIIEMDAVPTP